MIMSQRSHVAILLWSRRFVCLIFGVTIDYRCIPKAKQLYNLWCGKTPVVQKVCTFEIIMNIWRDSAFMVLLQCLLN